MGRMLAHLAPLLLVVIGSLPAIGADLVVTPGTLLEGDPRDVSRVIIRIERPGAYLVTSTPPLLPPPPLRFEAGDHAFGFDAAPAATRYDVRCETPEAVTERLVERASRGDVEPAPSMDATGATDAIDAIAARSDAPEWRRAQVEVHHAAGVRAARVSDLGRAITHHRTAASLARDLGMAPRESSSRRSLATLLVQIDDLDGAIDAAARYRDLERETGDPRAAAEADLWYGGLLSLLGFSDRAIGPLTSAAEAAAELGDPVFEAQVRHRFGDLAAGRGDTAAAREAFTLALRLGRAAQDDAVVANASIRLGMLDEEELRFEAAIERYRDVLELTDAPPSFRLEALSYVARCHYHRGEYEASLTTYDELVERGSADATGYFVAFGLQGGANALLRLGRFAEARARFRRALASSEAQGAGLRRNEILRTLAAIERTLGDAERARLHFEEALAFARERRDRIEEVMTLIGLAALERDAGAFDAAESRLDQAAARVGESANLTLYVEVGRVELRLEEEDAERALAAAERAWRGLGEATSGGGARRVLPLLARAYLAAGRTEEARRAAERAQGIAAPEDAAAHLAPLAVLAAAALETGDADAAERAIEEAARRLEQLAGRGDLEIERATGLRSRYAEFAALRHDLTALRHDPTATRDGSTDDDGLAAGFLAAGAWKGRGLLEGIDEHRRGERSREVTLLRQRLDTLEHRRAVVLEEVFERTYRAGADVTELRVEAEELRVRIEAAMSELELHSPRDAALARPRGTTAAVVRGVLTDGDRLIEFAEGRRRLYAFVLDRGALAFHDLGDLGTIRESVTRFVAAISTASRLAGVAEIATTGRALYETLLAPALGDARPNRLVIVPSISLSVLPFEALVPDAPKAPESFEELVFLDDRTEVSYAPSTPVFVALADAPPRPEGGRVLVLADPLYDSPDDDAEDRGPRLPRLVATRGEALALAALVRDGRVDSDGERAATLESATAARSGSYEDDRLALHFGARASRDRLLGPLRDVRILHLAAHGVVRRDSIRASGLQLGRRDGRPDLFSIRDALALDLDAQLVVLSACSTARGRPRRGEGIESLARAFIHAGARSVVASLWDVSDTAAVRTMQRFYEALLRDGLPPSQALRAARRELRRAAIPPGAARGVGSTRPAPVAIPAGHPFVWAPFIHVGALDEDGP